MLKRNPFFAVPVLAFFCTFVAWAGPVTTVPWNGYVGAVSFTFDDALKNQIDNLKPILEGLPDVKVTFFVTNMSNGLQGNAAGFAALANAGHEIGNHTLSHGHMTGQSESELNSEIVDFAGTIEKTLESAGANVKVVSFAARAQHVGNRARDVQHPGENLDSFRGDGGRNALFHGYRGLYWRF